MIKVLTTLLDPGAFPACEIAALYAERWQVEIAYLHLKKTVKGTGRMLRGRSVTLARQEAWALLLAHNMTATLAARAAGQAGIDPRLIPFTAVLVPDPRPRHRRYLLPALRQAPRQRKGPHHPARQPGPRPASTPGPARPDLRQDSLPAAELAHRRGRIHDNDRRRRISRKQTYVPEVKGSARRRVMNHQPATG